MTMAKTQEARCQRCGRSESVSICETLNCSINPDLKAKLLAGELMRMHCSFCGATSFLDYPLLYHDMQRGLLIQYISPDYCEDDEDLQYKLSPATDVAAFNSSQPYRFRVVRSVGALVEKIRIFDAELDDRVIEWAKVRYAIICERELANASSSKSDQPGDVSVLGPAVFKRSSQNDGRERLEFISGMGLKGPRTRPIPLTYFWPLEEYQALLANIEHHLPLANPINGHWHLVDRNFVTRRIHMLPQVPHLPRDLPNPEQPAATSQSSLWSRDVGRGTPNGDAFRNRGLIIAGVGLAGMVAVPAMTPGIVVLGAIPFCVFCLGVVQAIFNAPLSHLHQKWEKMPLIQRLALGLAIILVGAVAAAQYFKLIFK